MSEAGKSLISRVARPLYNSSDVSTVLEPGHDVVSIQCLLQEVACDGCDLLNEASCPARATLHLINHGLNLNTNRVEWSKVPQECILKKVAVQLNVVSLHADEDTSRALLTAYA